MEKLLQFKGHAIYKKADNSLVTEKGQVLSRSDYRMKTWTLPDRTVGFELNREDNVDFLFQRLSFLGDDKKYHSFGVSEQGRGNIPLRYAVAIYEKSDVAPNLLKKTRAIWGGHSEDEENGYALERCEAHIYPSEMDNKLRATRMTVISRDRKNGKISFNAFDLKVVYEGTTIKPKTVRLLRPDLHILARKMPTAYGCTGYDISDVTHELLAKFGIDSTKIIRPKTQVKIHNSDRSDR